jgi:hypothetical protein
MSKTYSITGQERLSGATEVFAKSTSMVVLVLVTREYHTRTPMIGLQQVVSLNSFDTPARLTRMSGVFNLK